MLLETLAAKLAAVFSGEDTTAKPSSFPYHRGGRAFLYGTPKAGAAPLAKDALRLLLGLISEEKSLRFGLGLSLRGGPSWMFPTSAPWLCGQGSQHLHGPLCSGRACSSNFSFPLAVLTTAPSSPAARIIPGSHLPSLGTSQPSVLQ